MPPVICGETSAPNHGTTARKFTDVTEAIRLIEVLTVVMASQRLNFILLKSTKLLTVKWQLRKLFV